MYTVILLVNNEYISYKFSHFKQTLDFCIEHYKEFDVLYDENYCTIYNELDYDGLGGFYFKYYCERIG